MAPIRRTRILLDIFHAMHRITASATHELYNWYTQTLSLAMLRPLQDDVEPVIDFLQRQETPMTFLEAMVKRSDWLRERVRRIAVSPEHRLHSLNRIVA